jgi:hypothetical protein
MSPKFPMPKLILSSLLVFSFMVGAINTIGANSQNPPINCQTASANDIQKAIHQKIKADPELTSEWKGLTKAHKHLSISYRKLADGSGEVTIIGFVSDEGRVKKVIDLVKSVTCVEEKKIKTEKFSHVPKFGCDPPNRLCGLLCIGKDDPCDLLN